MNRQWRAALALSAGLVWTLASHAATSGPVNFMQSFYFREFGFFGDELADRAGYEVENLAAPAPSVAATQQLGASKAFAALSDLGFDRNGSWEALGPTVGTVPGPVTYTGAATTNSGRVTSLVVSPHCDAAACTALVGAAGGGVWKSTAVLTRTPGWRPVSTGLPTSAIGSLLFDPTDWSGATVYVGTGEANGSGDSEAGLGLYKSTDGGEHWSEVPGSFAVSHDRAIAAIAVDPGNPRHLWIGTAVARHGSSAVNGGRFTPPGAPQIGLYESVDGGLHFSLTFSAPSDTVNPASANGSDFFRGGVTKILTYRNHGEDRVSTQVYFSAMDYGLFRSAANGLIEQVFASAGGGAVAKSLSSRTDFALAPMDEKLRIYLGDVGGGRARFYRVDNANVAAANLVSGGSNGGWITLSNSAPGTPGFSSYNFCAGQCSYDMFVASPAGKPDVVWLGGQMQYSEIFTPNPPSNGRAVIRSSNAGVSFTDMTNDAQTPAPIGMHPDQHAIAFVSGASDVALVGSDGGLVRTSGNYTNASGDCATRGLATAADLADCQLWLSAIPTEIVSLSAGLSTIQFQGLAVNARDPRNDVIGGTQDNGTWAYDGKTGTWFESIGGDGGPPALSPVTGVRMHTYTGAAIDVNFDNATPTFGWQYISDPLTISGEANSFYTPIVSDPQLAGTWFVGLQHLWRTTDNGGDPTDLNTRCNEYFGTFVGLCGDWQPLGGPAGSNTAGDLVGSAYGADKSGSYIVAIARGSSSKAPLWVATRRGRLFVSANANAADPSTVTYTRVDTAAQPKRFISGIAIDPENPRRAFVSFSGYEAYTPTTAGHVFEVVYNSDTGTAQWRDLSAGLGDQPITSIAYDGEQHRIYVATDFGVLVRDEGSWLAVAAGLPPTAVYQLVLDQGSHLLYAATHGRGAYRINTED